MAYDIIPGEGEPGSSDPGPPGSPVPSPVINPGLLGPAGTDPSLVYYLPYYGGFGWMNQSCQAGRYGGAFLMYEHTYWGDCFPEDHTMQPSFLSALIDDVRLLIEDPSVSEKFSDAEIMRLAGASFRRVFRDINTVSSRPYVLTHDVSITTSTTRYELPPSIGEVLICGEWDSTIEDYKWVNAPTSRYNPYRRGAWLEGRTIKLAKAATQAYTLRIEYIPSGDFWPHEAVRCFNPATLSDATQTFALIEPRNESDSTLLLRGYVDARQDAYIGATMRIWNLAPQSESPVQPVIMEERIITDYTIDQSLTGQGNGATRLVTVNMPWGTSITQNGSDVYQYEIVPSGAEGVRLVMAMATAMTLCTGSGLRERKAMITDEYRLAIRNERLFEAYFSPYAQKFITDTRESQFGGFMPR